MSDTLPPRPCGHPQAAGRGDRCLMCEMAGRLAAGLLPCGHPARSARPGGCSACDAIAAMPPGGPSLARRALNLAGAAARHVAAGLPRVDRATHDARVAACASCEMNVGTAAQPKCRHPSCGCRMTVKAWMAEQRCPHPAGSRWENG